MASSTVERIGTLIDQASSIRLSHSGFAIENFEWLVPNVGITMHSGRREEGCFCGATNDGRIVVFPVPTEGERRFDSLLGDLRNRAGRTLGRHELVQFEIGVCPLDAVQAALVAPTSGIELHLQFGSGNVKLVSLAMQAETLRSAAGDWLAMWREKILCEMGLSTEHALGVVTIATIVPSMHEFGTGLPTSTAPVFCAIGAHRTFPRCEVPWVETEQWTLNRAGAEPVVSMLGVSNGVPTILRIAEFPVGDREVVVESLCQMLAGTRKSGADLSLKLGASGIFRAQSGPSADLTDVCLTLTSCGVEYASAHVRYEFGFGLRSGAVLVARDGSHLQIELHGSRPEDLLRHLQNHDELLESNGDRRLAVVMRSGDAERAVLLTLDRASVWIEDIERIDYREVESLELARIDSGQARLTANVMRDGRSTRLTFLGPEKLITALCAEWEVRRTETALATAQTARLYVEFSETKKFNLLSALFGDVLLLNQELSKGATMEELLREIDALGEEDFSNNKRLREATMTKVVLLSVTLPRLKQKLELLRALYPYSWVKQDATWLETVFGQRCRTVVERERRRAVPLVRREVAQVQANIQRSLAAIDEALRPLESLFGRGKIQDQWFAQLTRYAPPVLYAGAAVSAVATGGAALLGAMPILAGVVGSGISLIRGDWVKSKEADLQFQRAAKAIFPWWQVFLRTLAVSVYETAAFIEEENTRAMRRDRQLFDQLPAPEKAVALKRIEAALRERILAERRAAFGEMIEGTGICLQTVIGDLQRTLQREAAQFALEFKNEAPQTQPF